MNELYNIKVENNILYFDYKPEWYEKAGHVEYDISKKEFIIIQIPDLGEQYLEKYPKLSTWFLLDMIAENKIKDKMIHMWY